jgi:hypothetical protein
VAYETQADTRKVTRHRAIGACGGLIIGAPMLAAAPFPNDVQVTDVRTSCEDCFYRTPIKFGGNVVDRVTLLNVNCTVHEAARFMPGVIDESLIGIGPFSWRLWNVPASRSRPAKGQSHSLLMVGLGQRRKLFLCVQGLTCPSASLVDSVTPAAHVCGMKAIEANARQYVPAANAAWEKRFPGVFIVCDGLVRTDGTSGPGIGVIPS